MSRDIIQGGHARGVGRHEGGTGKNLISKSPKINCAWRLIVLWPCASKRCRGPAASIYTGNVIFTTAYIPASSQPGHPFRSPPASFPDLLPSTSPWYSSYVPGFTVLHAKGSVLCSATLMMVMLSCVHEVVSAVRIPRFSYITEYTMILIVAKAMSYDHGTTWMYRENRSWVHHRRGQRCCRLPE